MPHDRIETPHLTTALSGPLHHLEQVFLNKQSAIEAWFRQQWQQAPAPITSSVDLRNAGFKLAPVDTNLFPAGFNNLNPDFFPLCVQAAQTAIERRMPGCRRILLIPESHTRNPFYFDSLATLHAILLQAGYEVRIGSLLEELKAPKKITRQNGETLLLEPVMRSDDKLHLQDFEPCFILLNNDFSEGIPAILQGITQLIQPAAELGWFSRSKFTHFNLYEKLSHELAQLIDLDPWLISPLSRHCKQIDFTQTTGDSCLTTQVESLLQTIQKKYDEYQVTQKPFAVIKADAGTYGMGVMMVQEAEQVQNLNRKQRARMSKTKGGQAIDKVIIQEGVYTFETLGDAVAEPVVYLIGHHVIGGFYRVHTARGDNENLNAPGMHFEPLAFAETGSFPKNPSDPQQAANRFYAYGVIARLAALAAAYELEGQQT